MLLKVSIERKHLSLDTNQRWIINVPYTFLKDLTNECIKKYLKYCNDNFRDPYENSKEYNSWYEWNKESNKTLFFYVLKYIALKTRLSDLQQRLGRIVRQGNENKEVEVFRYVTEKTFDAYSYQLLQKKQEFISQIMTSKTPVRTSNDVDESVLSYAEIKALAAGNPLIIEKTQLESELSKYRMLKSSYYTQIYSIQDKVAKFYPQEINRLENLIEGYKKDIELVKNNTKLNKEDFSPMELNGHTYENKKEAGQKLIEICKSNLSEEKVSIGNYKGMEMLIEFDPFIKQYNLYLKNEVSHNVELGTDPLGNITRIDNCINNFEENMERNQEQLERTKKQFENAKIEENKPFEKEEEMKKVRERLNQINAELKINENENIIMEDNREEEREKEFKKNKNKDDDFDLN